MDSCFGRVPPGPQIDEDIPPVRERAEASSRSRRATDRTFGRSHGVRAGVADVAPPDVVDPTGHAWGQPLSQAAGAKPGLFVGARVCGGPSGLRSADGLHRGCARGVGQRAPVCRCAATRRSKQHEIERRRRPFRGRRVWEPPR